ncbi:MAG: GNAT family N-acetyltransferase [Deltaproteobacteria bacterium]|nr:GNAT family N-acetyltransferase [Deltaproteobacteria bacterium]
MDQAFAGEECGARIFCVPEMRLRTLRRIREVSAADWDRLVLSQSSPFMKWEWLQMLEETGCVNERKGWLPHHIVVERDGNLVAACPMYLKLHSMGEFVFDYDWAEFARQLGIEYYPKIIVGVPFTPVTGARFLTGNSDNRRSLIQLMGQALKRMADQNRLSSVHVNFCLEDEAGALEELGFFPRAGLQFHWQNRNFDSFEDYLRAFRSERRNKIKRERRELLNQRIAIRAVEGDQVTPEELRVMFRLYKRHIDQLYYGRQYLTREFFEGLGGRFSRHICLLFAEQDSRVIAGTFNIQDENALYGRYWGAFKDERYLHFNVCYYSAIEHCIRRGLSRFEAGAGGSFKQFRGLDPEPTRSMHYIRDGRFRRSVELYLQQEREIIAQKRIGLLQTSQLKQP